jgi:phosphate transport system substrate-binding protein
MMNDFKLAALSILFLFAVQGCKQKDKVPAYNDTWLTGTAKFAGDESFAPIVDEELYVFKALNKKADPQVTYRDENDVLRLLLNDSVRAIFLSRELDSNELKVLKARALYPSVSRFAIDAVVLIVNTVSNDTTITVGEIRKILAGEEKSSMNIVFDNANSSLVRYLKGVAGISDFKPKNVFALKSNKEVIKYISTHTNAIGITSFSWLDDPEPDYADAVSKVKIVAVKDENSKQFAAQYFKPSQTSLALKQYPLSRDLYIINCTGRQGLGSGVEKFFISDRGQRIILKSGLLPDNIPGREIRIVKAH